MLGMGNIKEKLTSYWGHNAYMKDKNRKKNEAIDVFFPFPFIADKTKHDGILISQPKECVSCKVNECFNATNNLLVCTYGYEYIRITPKYSINGITTLDKNTNNPKKVKHSRIKSKDRIHSSLIDKLTTATNKRSDNIALARINNNSSTPSMEHDELKKIQPPLSSFFHDYKQINSQLSQNMEVLLKNNFNVKTVADDNEYADSVDSVEDENIKALYYGIKLLSEKLDAFSIIEKPEQLRSPVENTRSRIHGIVKKYLKIYDPQIKHRNLQIDFAGVSYNLVWANPKSLTIIPHALIDNAIKYAPVNSTIRIETRDEADHVYLSVTSLGPKIERNETKDIFKLHYRSKNAVSKHSEGSGIGLYSANLVAQLHFSSTIRVKQNKEPDHSYSDYFKTQFSVELPYNHNF